MQNSKVPAKPDPALQGKTQMSKISGFGIIEIIVAMGIMIIIAATGATTVLHSFSANRLGDEETGATRFAQEGVEALRSIKNQDWANLSVGTYGLDNSAGTWALLGTSDTDGKYTRQIVISQVQRDTNGDVVTSGGTVDPDTLKATSNVTWNFSPTRNNSVSLVTYLTNFEKPIGAGDWTNPRVSGSLDLSGSADGFNLAVQEDYLYLVRRGGDPDFVSISISDRDNPVLLDSFAISGSPRNIFVSGNYAYVVSTSDGEELRIFDISDPSNLTQLGFYNAPGSANGMGVWVVGTISYIVRERSSADEFVILDVSDPLSPQLLGSTGLGQSDDGEEVWVSGDYAYVGTDHDSRELEVVDVSNPSAPTVVASFNASSSSSPQSIHGTGNIVVLGRNNGHTHIFDVTNPTSPIEADYYDAEDDTEDIDIYDGGDYVYAFLGTDKSNFEFQLLDITDPYNVTLVSGLDIADQINGIAYHSEKDRVYVASEADNAELMVFAPQ